MQWISRAGFVAAMAEAGGTGFLPAASFDSPGALLEEIQLTRSLTDKPFGVNISVLPDAGAGDASASFVELIIRENIPFIETSGRLLKNLIPPLREAGVKILHKVTVPKHAKTAQENGVDAVIIVGYEGAGHPGMAEVGTFVNLPATVDVLDIPVVAAGGVCDGRSMAAAFALGADGVLMGTRLLATKECPVHRNLKEWVVGASITDTIIIQRSIRNALRAINNRKALEVLGMEQLGVDIKDLLPHISGKQGLLAMENGYLETAVLTAGQVSGRINEILPVSEVIKTMTDEFSATLPRLQDMSN
jgi:nitronate monooxygenase